MPKDMVSICQYLCPTGKVHCILIDSSTKVYRRSTSTTSKFDVMDMKPGREETLNALRIVFILVMH